MKRLILFMLLLGFCGGTEALACSCIRLLPCEFYQRASAVFLGQNISESDRGLLTFRVIEAFKGVKGDTIQVGFNGVFCAAHADPKETVLVYALKNEKGKLVTHNCGYVQREGLLDFHLTYLRKASGSTGGRIFGDVTDDLSLYSLKKAPPEVFQQIRVRVTAGTTEHLLKLKEDHSFEITGLPPAIYTVELLLPEKYISFRITKEQVEIGEQGCGAVWFTFCLQEDEPPSKRNETHKTKHPS